MLLVLFSWLQSFSPAYDTAPFVIPEISSEKMYVLLIATNRQDLLLLNSCWLAEIIYSKLFYKIPGKRFKNKVQYLHRWYKSNCVFWLLPPVKISYLASSIFNTMHCLSSRLIHLIEKFCTTIIIAKLNIAHWNSNCMQVYMSVVEFIHDFFMVIQMNTIPNCTCSFSVFWLHLPSFPSFDCLSCLLELKITFNSFHQWSVIFELLHIVTLNC